MPGRLRRSLPALSHRDFRLLWTGQFASTIGSQMQSAAILWHITLLVPDHKGLALGLVGLAKVVPIITFSLIAGVVADALDRRKVLLATQAVMAVAAAGLATLTFRGLEAVWPVYLLAALSAGAFSFDGPSRQAMLPSLVPPHHLANAISLNTIMHQASSIIGPSLAGIVIAAAGTAWVYALNAASFAFVITALLAMRSRTREGGPVPRVTLTAAREGLRFVFRTPVIRSSMLVDFFATFFFTSAALLPIFAQDILQVGPRCYGWLYAAPSIGAVLASSVLVLTVDRIRRQGAVLLGAVALYGMATMVFGLSRNFGLAFICLAFIGLTDTVSTVIRNVVRQMETPDALRGRMTSVNMVFFTGGPQLGQVQAGLVTQLFGARVAVVAGGLGCLAAMGIIAAAEPALRRYHRREHANHAPAVIPSEPARTRTGANTLAAGTTVTAPREPDPSAPAGPQDDR